METTAESQMRRYEQKLRAHPEGLATVRCIVRAYLLLWGHSDLVDATMLCITELLANVSKHATSPDCMLTLQSSGDSVRGSVSDTDSTLPVIKEPDCLAESGRGMSLIDRTADKWGAEPTPTGKEVWFELRGESAGVWL